MQQTDFFSEVSWFLGPQKDMTAKIQDQICEQNWATPSIQNSKKAYAVMALSFICNLIFLT